MKIIRAVFSALTAKERRWLIGVFAVFLAASLGRITLAIQEKSDWVAAPGGVYTEGVVGQPIAINPIISGNLADQDISALVYSRLFDLMNGYEVNNSGRVYVIKLKEDLKWSDGEPLTSDDVIFTLKTIQDSESGSPLARSWRGVAAERISELQLQLALPAPYSFFTDNLKRLAVIPKHIFGNVPAANLKLSGFNLEPVGSGPYKFKGYSKKKDGFITKYNLEVNKYYAGDKPFIKDFSFKFYRSQDELTKAFKMREITGFGALNPLDAGEILAKNASKITAEKILMPRYYAIFFNQNINPLLKNPDLRYALDAAIPKESIVQNILENRAEPISGPLPKNLSGIAADGYNFDAAKSRFDSLKNPNIELNLIVPKVDFLQKSAEAIKEKWLELGVKSVNLIVLNSDDILQNVIKPNNYEMILFGNTLENPVDLFPFWHSSERFYPGLNLALYQNQKADNLMESVRENKDSARQLELSKEADGIIAADLPAAFLFEMPYIYVHIKDLGGFSNEGQNFFANPSDRFLNISHWYLSKVRVIKNK